MWQDVEVRRALARGDYGAVSRLVRERTGLLQGQLAALTGLSQGNVSMLESGNRRLARTETISAFLTALGVPEDLRYPPHPPPPQQPTEPDAHTLSASAAATSLRFLEHLGPSNTSDEAIELLNFEVSRIAVAYVHAPLRPLLRDLIDLRDHLFHLLQGHQRPLQTRELLALAGTTCLLLAHASQNLGDQHAAMAQIYTAWSCAEQADHTGLKAWVRGTAGLIAEWSPQQSAALQFAMHGAALAPAGPARIRIAAIEARAAARAGDQERARSALDRLHTAREETPQPDGVSDHGGLLTFPEAKREYYLGGTYTLLGQHTRAAQHTQAALRMYASGPQEERSYGDEALARIDLATARLAHSDLDGVAEALSPVLALPGPFRIRQLAHAVHRLEGALRHPRLIGNARAKELADLTREYRAIERTSPLPSLR